MALNKNKSGILAIENKSNASTNPELHNIKYIQNIPFVRTYKYLGITIDSNLNFLEHIQSLQKKTQ